VLFGSLIGTGPLWSSHANHAWYFGFGGLRRRLFWLGFLPNFICLLKKKVGACFSFTFLVLFGSLIGTDLFGRLHGVIMPGIFLVSEVCRREAVWLGFFCCLFEVLLKKVRGVSVC
jgi:hypothetical protein